MRRQQADRAVIARRATPSTPNHGRPSVSLLARNEPVKAPVGAVRNRKAGKLTPLQRNAEGRRSEWSMPNEPDRWIKPVVIDRRWGMTAREC